MAEVSSHTLDLVALCFNISASKCFSIPMKMVIVLNVVIFFRIEFMVLVADMVFAGQLFYAVFK